MIYILTGNDTKKKNAYLKKLSKKDQLVFIPRADITKENFFEYAGSISLFGDSPVVVADDILNDEDIKFSAKELLVLKDSKTVFVFLEEKLPASQIKEYKKYGIVEDFSTQALAKKLKMNTFSIAEAFSRRDKIGTWILYREAVSLGIAPEEISGIIFWKIKMMLLNGTKVFSSDELKSSSSNLVDIYHKAHRGECDFIVGLEQFILSSLNK
ncbi:MAG: hypothetical protein WC603_01470 [Candidatus Paceibacterota bacterium]|jgi:hypothetical protein